MEYNFIRDRQNEKFGLLPLQDKILEIAVYIDKLCKDNHIEYCLMGGSALGAKRHGGFIPWDDDLDIFMTPDNYDKFRMTFLNTGDKENFYLQEWGAFDGMVTISKIRMNGTSYIEESLKDYDIHQGIYVDIFIMHTCPNKKIKQLYQCLWAKYVIMKGLAIRGYKRRGGFLGSVLKIMKLLPDKMWVKYGLKQVYKYRNKQTDFYCNFMGKAVFKNAIYRKEYFAPTEYVPFEKVLLKVPVKLHEFLSDRFGDYMTPPTFERIRWEQHAKSWSVDTDFREVVEGITLGFTDEKKLI